MQAATVSTPGGVIQTSFLYEALAAEHPPEDLADLIHQAKVAKRVAQRIDDLERIARQHRQNLKNQERCALSTAAICLGLSPSLIAMAQVCQPGGTASWTECGSRLSAIVSSVIALGVTVWSGWEIYQGPRYMERHLGRLNEELDRMLMSKGSQVRVLRLFDRYERMKKPEQKAFRDRLHFLICSQGSDASLVGADIGLAPYNADDCGDA